VRRSPQVVPIPKRYWHNGKYHPDSDAQEGRRSYIFGDSKDLFSKQIDLVDINKVWMSYLNDGEARVALVVSVGIL
jgi:hypothetical protein